MKAHLILLTFLGICTSAVSEDRELVAPDGTVVTIHRDEYGVPHILGETEVGVFFGQGFAVAGDRLWQMELHRRAAQGRLAELFGYWYRDLDVYARTVGYSHEEITAQFNAMPAEIQTMFQSYAAGINTYLDSMATNPTAYKPYEFEGYGVEAESWGAYDALTVGQFMARVFGQFGGEELTRLSELNAYGEEWFDENRPINDPSAPTTIPDSAAASSSWSYSGIRVRQEVIQAMNERKERLRALAGTVGLPAKFGSFAVLISPSKSVTGDVMLLGCPQMGEPQESEVQTANEVELRCPSLHVGGMTIAGIPGVIIGHTEHHAWTLTSGISDNTDVYIDSTSDASYSQYLHNGQWLDFETIQDTVKILGYPDHVFTHYRTIHGPVVGDDLEEHQVFAEKMTFWELEHGMTEFLYNSYKAESLGEFELALQNAPMSFNVFYADVDQNSKYWHSGKYQDRTDGVDPRLPHKGDGTEEWGAFIDFADLPQSEAPHQGYLVNWNNKPVSWWNNGDNVPWVGWHHVAYIDAYVSSIEGFSYQNLKDVPVSIGSHGTYQQAIELTGVEIIDENILPPGQSGFIDIFGNPSVHFDDQWPLHVAWEFKDMLFGEEINVVVDEPRLPREFVLDQNYPNPFNPGTVVRFTLRANSYVRLVIYDILGQQVEELVNGRIERGTHEVVWDASGVATGIYFCRLSVGQDGILSNEQTRKLVVLK